MFLSKHKNGNYYVYYININGKRNKVSTKTKYKSAALKFLSKFENRLQSSLTYGIKLITLDKFFWEFLKYSESIHTSKTTKGFKSSLRRILKYFGDIQLVDLTKQSIEVYLQHRAINQSLYSARTDYINLSSTLTKAVEDGYLKENPMKKIRPIKIPQKLPVYFSDNELKILLEAVDNKDLRELVIFAANTGLRQMELITLCWNQIDFNNKIIILDNHTHITKSKKIRSVPLNNTAMDIIFMRNIKAESCFIFTYNGAPIKQDFISHKFKKYVRKANLNDSLNFHSLRHSFASWLVQKGVSIYQISKLLGHSDIKTTQIYAHLRAEDLRKTVMLLDN